MLLGCDLKRIKNLPGREKRMNKNWGSGEYEMRKQEKKDMACYSPEQKAL